jgi:hypothetical protein
LNNYKTGGFSRRAQIYKVILLVYTFETCSGSPGLVFNRRIKKLNTHRPHTSTKEVTFYIRQYIHKSQHRQLSIHGTGRVMVIVAAWWQTEFPPRAGALGTEECYPPPCMACVGVRRVDEFFLGITNCKVSWPCSKKLFAPDLFMELNM